MITQELTPEWADSVMAAQEVARLQREAFIEGPLSLIGLIVVVLLIVLWGWIADSNR